MNCSIEIIICTEKGPLENMSKLLVSSIRLLDGVFKDIPIYSYTPRPDFAVSRETRDFFENMGVELVDEVLNTKYVDYPLANKPLACAHRASHSEADYLLFLDSDTFFCGLPQLLVDGLTDADVAMGPVDFNNIGTDLRFSSGESAYWSSLYSLLDAKPRKDVFTRIYKEKILEYYNSGFVFVRRGSGLFGQWLKNFNRVMASNLKPSKGIFFVEQSCLSATLAQMNLKVLELGTPYNYPITAMTKRWRGYYPFSLSKIKHVHYHKLFKNTKGDNPIQGKLRSVDNGSKLNALIKQYLLQD